MSKQLTTLINRIKKFPDVVKAAITAAENDEELTQVLGITNSVTSALRALKVKNAVELPTGASGGGYQVKRGKSATRSYNFSSLVLLWQERLGHASALQTIMWLIDEDILRVSWQWTNLKSIASEYGAQLRIVTGRTVDNGDPDADVGEVWEEGNASFSETGT